jgi:hypothetical protein
LIGIKEIPVLDSSQEAFLSFFFKKIQITPDPAGNTGVITIRQYFSKDIGSFLF